MRIAFWGVFTGKRKSAEAIPGRKAPDIKSSEAIPGRKVPEIKSRHTDTMIRYAAVNDKGFVRSNNEDNFFVNGLLLERGHQDDGASVSGTNCDENQIYAVCDGMGGIEAGEDASFCAVKMLESWRTCQPDFDRKELIVRKLRNISGQIARDAAARGQRSGTTMAMAVIKGNRASIINVGDSRVYLFRKQRLRQLSLDHSKVQQKVDMGLMSAEEARSDPERHIISQYLGMPENIQISPYIVPGIEIENGDLFLLCSDGLTDMVEDQKIEDNLKMKKEPEEAAEALLKLALEKGGRDNVTIIILKACSMK